MKLVSLICDKCGALIGCINDKASIGAAQCVVCAAADPLPAAPGGGPEDLRGSIDRLTVAASGAGLPDQWPTLLNDVIAASRAAAVPPAAAQPPEHGFFACEWPNAHICRTCGELREAHCFAGCVERGEPDAGCPVHGRAAAAQPGERAGLAETLDQFADVICPRLAEILVPHGATYEGWADAADQLRRCAAIVRATGQAPQRGRGYRIAGEPVSDVVGAEFGRLIAERDRLRADEPSEAAVDALLRVENANAVEMIRTGGLAGYHTEEARREYGRARLRAAYAAVRQGEPYGRDEVRRELP